MSFSILSRVSKRSKNATRGSRTSVKARVKVDELKILESICWLLVKYYFLFTDSLIFLFCLISLKTWMYMNMVCQVCLRAFKIKKNIG